MKQTIQIQLQRIVEDSTVSTTVWVPYDNKAKRVKLGMQISLKDEDERWTVVGISDPKDGKPNRGWNNNI